MKKTQRNLLLAISRLLLALCPLSPAFGQEVPGKIAVDIQTTLNALLADEDTDGDKKITIDDAHLVGSEQGDKRFWMRTVENQVFEVSGTYYLSNLLQELKLAEAEAAPDGTAQLAAARIFEPPVDRLSRSIKELFWSGLTRRVDEEGLQTILADEKTNTIDGMRYVYVPASDQTAFDYFTGVAQRHPEWRMKVVRLPRNISAPYVRNLDGRHGILSLALVPRPGGGYEGLPFVVPGGRFNEMYGWDSYFIALGLLHDGRTELAKAMVDNFVHEITHYGAILNANRTYYLTRSQPPFLTSMALAVYQHLPREAASKAWLQGVLAAAIQEYRTVWMNPDRLTKIGLSRYFDSGFGAPPEVEPGHFDVVFAAHAKKHGMAAGEFEAAYRAGRLKEPELDAYFVHDRAMRESGHDTSYRLEGRCANLVTVDLNSLLYKIERDIAKIIEEEFAGVLKFGKGRAERSADWRKAAERRRDLMNRHLWNAERGMFFDYDFVQKRQTAYESATTFYPLWAGAATPEQAERLVRSALPLFEMPGGLAGSTEASRGRITPEHPPRQWDFPNGWAPHQMLVWQGLINYGYNRIAQRLIYRWLYTITFNAANYNGTVPEKFDVATRSHQVFAEYGNVGTKFSYITREGFGWTNTSYQLGVSLLPQEWRDSLNRLIPPEWLF